MDPRTALCLLLMCIAPGAYSQGNCLCARGFCDEGWVQYKDSCYKAVMKGAKWTDAEMECQSQGKFAHLASIHSAEENDFIFLLMGKLQDYTKGQAYWIGGHDTFKEGSFVWTDGSEFDFQNYGPSQPSGENYLGSWSVQKGHITWNDFVNDASFPFVCKYPLRHSASAGSCREL
ncbi:lectin-like isoform X1 [Pelodiscus sinensis]|uniref:lectin-like isoform X1 n=1 Tax=Pelodiscus sinensis TaxID=13735 RepID=UPI003F6BEFE0